MATLQLTDEEQQALPQILNLSPDTVYKLVASTCAQMGVHNDTDGLCVTCGAMLMVQACMNNEQAMLDAKLADGELGELVDLRKRSKVDPHGRPQVALPAMDVELGDVTHKDIQIGDFVVSITRINRH